MRKIGLWINASLSDCPDGREFLCDEEGRKCVYAYPQTNLQVRRRAWMWPRSRPRSQTDRAEDVVSCRGEHFVAGVLLGRCVAWHALKA